MHPSSDPASPSPLGSLSIKGESIEQHSLEIEHNRQSWRRKPLLKEIYRELYQTIVSRLNPALTGDLVELGSGMGSIKEVLPQCITTDVFPNPWLDRQENAYQLSFPDASVSHLILLDVWHHLRYPGTALREFHRVLKPGGRVILCEPALSWTGTIIYGLFHHEPIARHAHLSWDAPATFSPANIDYYAAPSSATRLFWHGSLSPRQLAGWQRPEVIPLTSFAYIGSGGFSGPQLYPTSWLPAIRWLDRQLSAWPRAFATRLLIVLEKEAFA